VAVQAPGAEAVVAQVPRREKHVRRHTGSAAEAAVAIGGVGHNTPL